MLYHWATGNTGIIHFMPQYIAKIHIGSNRKLLQTFKASFQQKHSIYPINSCVVLLWNSLLVLADLLKSHAWIKAPGTRITYPRLVIPDLYCHTSKSADSKNTLLFTAFYLAIFGGEKKISKVLHRIALHVRGHTVNRFIDNPFPIFKHEKTSLFYNQPSATNTTEYLLTFITLLPNFSAHCHNLRDVNTTLFVFWQTV